MCKNDASATVIRWATQSEYSCHVKILITACCSQYLQQRVHNYILRHNTGTTSVQLQWKKCKYL